MYFFNPFQILLLNLKIVFLQIIHLLLLEDRVNPELKIQHAQVHSYIHSFIYLFIYLSIQPFTHLSIHPSFSFILSFFHVIHSFLPFIISFMSFIFSFVSFILSLIYIILFFISLKSFILFSYINLFILVYFLQSQTSFPYILFYFFAHAVITRKL